MCESRSFDKVFVHLGSDNSKTIIGENAQ